MQRADWAWTYQLYWNFGTKWIEHTCANCTCQRCQETALFTPPATRALSWLDWRQTTINGWYIVWNSRPYIHSRQRTFRLAWQVSLHTNIIMAPYVSDTLVVPVCRLAALLHTSDISCTDHLISYISSTDHTDHSHSINDVVRAAGWEPCSVHGLGHVFWAGTALYALYRSSTISLTGRRGTRSSTVAR